MGLPDGGRLHRLRRSPWRPSREECGIELAGPSPTSLPSCRSQRRRIRARPVTREALDENRTCATKAARCVAGLQAAITQTSGIKSLKVRHNNVLGYFVETQRHPMRQADAGRRSRRRFIHRQTLASAVRFTTTELGELEAKITAAADRALAIELEVFDEL